MQRSLRSKSQPTRRLSLEQLSPSCGEDLSHANVLQMECPSSFCKVYWKYLVPCHSINHPCITDDLPETTVSDFHQSVRHLSACLTYKNLRAMHNLKQNHRPKTQTPKPKTCQRRLNEPIFTFQRMRFFTSFLPKPFL